MVYSHNELPANHKGYGNPMVTTHLHNAHNASESDGNPVDLFGPGTYRPSTIPTCMPVVTNAKPWASCGSMTTAWTTRHRTFIAGW